MTKSGLMAITCAIFVAPACSSGPDKETTSGTGTANAASSTSSGSSGSTGGNSSASGGSTGSGAGASASGGATGTGPGGTVSSTGTTTGITGPDFALTATPNPVTLPAGGEGVVQVNIQRDAGTVFDSDDLIFAMAADGGIAGIFDPSEAAGDATALTLDVDPTVPAGDYPILINASSARDPLSGHETTLTLTVSSGVVATLLVDNDASSNNADGGGLPSPSDAFFAQLLQSSGILYNSYVISSLGTDEFDSTVLQNYSTVVWYTGANNLQNGNGCLSSFQEQFLEMWLNQGGKTLLMFSPYLVQDLEPVPYWQYAPSNNFLSLYLGAAGCGVNPQGNFDGKSFVATGVDGTQFGTPDGGAVDGGALVFDVEPSPVTDTAAVINVGDGGTVPLVTVEGDELGIGQPQALPCTVLNTRAGTAGTSTVVYVGMPIEDIQPSDAGSAASFFTALQQSLP